MLIILYFYLQKKKEKKIICDSFKELARKESTVNFFTSMICPKCHSVISTQNSVSYYTFERMASELSDIKILVGACHAKDCPFRHSGPAWSETGSCSHGPGVGNRQRTILCKNYLAGFCPSGSNCTNAHPR